MMALRSLLYDRHLLAMLLIAAALLARALVPAGYMPAGGERTLSIMLCADANVASVKIVVPMGSPAPVQKGHAGGDHPCAFGGLAAATLGGADLPLLAVAIRHILTLGFAPTATPEIPDFTRLRPPLRGPPALS